MSLIGQKCWAGERVQTLPRDETAARVLHLFGVFLFVGLMAYAVAKMSADGTR